MIPDPARKLTGIGAPRRIKVLRYHRIGGGHLRHPNLWPCMHVEHFRQHLELLIQWGFTPITFQDYRLFLKGEMNLPRKPVILTFDLAYKDNYTYMFSAMQKFGAKGVVFASGDRHQSETTWLAHEGLPVAPLMNDQDLIEMHEAGFEIGSHGMTYTDLTLLPLEQAAEEISRSRILLEILLNASVLTFSYPFGAVTPGTKRLVSESGYTVGCVMGNGPRRFTSDLFNVRRISVGEPLHAVRLRGKLLFA